MISTESRRILIAAPGFVDDTLFNADSRDNVMEPWVVLRQRLSGLGYALETADNKPVDDCAWVLIWDWSGGAGPAGWVTRAKRRLRAAAGRAPDELYADCLRAGLVDRMVFIIGEPPTVELASWDPRVHRLFQRVLTYDDRLVDGKRFFKYCWPIPAAYPSGEAVSFGERKLVTSISANKASSEPGELYSERRRAIAFYEGAIPTQFDLYGVGWREPTPEGREFASYRGMPRHKWEVLPRYRFSVCYENTGNVPGYITEKIFDSLRCGCVPIYLGAPNIADYVDPAAFIDRRAFGSDAEVLDFISKVADDDFEAYLRAGRRFLESEACRRFTSPAFADTLVRSLGLR